jgi:hypothetical protein
VDFLMDTIMISNNTQRIFEVKAFRIFILTFFLFFNFNAFSQTITDVFPTRVTSGSEITVLGTGFEDPSFDINNIDISGVAIDVSSITIVSDTELIFSISNTYSFGSIPDPADALDRILTVGGSSTSSPDLIDYIAPTLKDYTNVNGNGIRVTEVFTDWDYTDLDTGINHGYFRSSWYVAGNLSTYPNDRHDLLAFTIDEQTYSTGVDDARLDDPNGDGNFSDAIPYTAQEYKAYSTNGVSGFPNNANLLLMADAIDGALNASVLNAQVSATAYDVIIDGVNGLDMGTGIANFNRDTSVRFFSGNGIFGAVTDNIPDLLITQIANSSGNQTDVYYYADLDGDIVGRPIRLRIARNTRRLFDWQLDIYAMNTSVPYNISYPTSAVIGPDEKRKFRMVGLKLSDFDIGDDDTGPNWIGDINNINALAGGAADMAFMAYNKAAFDIKSPEIDQFPLARNICRVPSTGNSIEFSALASLENPSDPMTTPQSELDKEEIFYQWYKDFTTVGPKGPLQDSFLLPSTITVGDLGNYKVRISNEFGVVDLPVTLSEGGTPTFWNGSNWVFPNNYFDNQDPMTGTLLFPIPDEERNLIFSADYSSTDDLVGCDCRVLRDRVVTIPGETTLKLYSELIVEDELILIDDNGDPLPAIPAGNITFGDDASLIQTKAVMTNANAGTIKMQREASDLNLNDYMYWASPVTGFDIANIPGASALTYQWDPTAGNTGMPASTGNWVSASGIMSVGEGYIKRVPSGANFTTVFTGIPNNGVIDVDVFKSSVPEPISSADKHWNLIGNPYPSAINAETFLLANTNLVGFVNLWTRGDGLFNDGVVTDPFYADFEYNYADEYLTHNGTGSSPSGFDGKIASGQAFFVQVLDASSDTDVRFNNAMRYDGDGAENAYDNSAFFRSSNPEIIRDTTLEKQLIWLGLVNESNSSSNALLGYVDGATDGIDRMYDAPRSGEGMSIYSVLEDNKISIQGRSYPFETSDMVALGVDLLEDGIYKIIIDTVEGSVFENETQGIYLEDTYLNVVHDLRTTPYSFAGMAGTVKDRFVLKYTADQQLSVDEQHKLNTFIYVKEERLYVKSSKNIEAIVLYDLTGKQVVNYKQHENVSQSFSTAFQYPKGAYIAVINLEGNLVMRKKLIN